MFARLDKYKVTLRDATQDDLDAMVANLRDMDRREHAVYGGGRIPLDGEGCVWAVAIVHDDAGLVGVMRSCLIGDKFTRDYPVRTWAYYTTEAANKIKMTYVKAAREVFAELSKVEDKSVERIVLFPAEFYKMSIKFYKKILGAYDSGESFVESGVKHNILFIDRKAV